MNTYTLRFPWRAVSATAPSRLRAYVEIVRHEFLELTRGSVYAHGRPAAVRYALGIPTPQNTPGLKGKNYPASPFTLNVGPLSITDGSLERVFLASGTGLSLYDENGFPTVVAADGGIVLKQGQSFVVQKTLSDVVRASLAPGQLILADPDGNTIVDIESAFGGMLLKDASGIERVKLFNDGSGLTLSDSSDVPYHSIGETAVALYAAAGLDAASRPAVPTQVVAVDVDDFNAIRTAMIALGIWTDGD